MGKKTMERKEREDFDGEVLFQDRVDDGIDGFVHVFKQKRIAVIDTKFQAFEKVRLTERSNLCEETYRGRKWLYDCINEIVFCVWH